MRGLRARDKDDARGAAVIDDYADVHVTADRDRVVRQAWEDADRIAADVEQYFRRFPAEHCHRVEIPEALEGKTWSLCLFFPNRRRWGFFVKGKNWVSSQDYFRDFGGTGGCD